MRTYEAEHKAMLEKHADQIEKFEARKRLWEAAYDMSREWKGVVYGAYDNWWVTFTPEDISIKRFKELMYKYFHHNPDFTIEKPTGTGEDYSSLTILIRDGNAYLEITLNKRGLSSCKVITETVSEMKERENAKYICEGGAYDE